MRIRCAAGVLSAVALIGCSRAQWPDPPAIDQAKYQDEYKAWREERQETLLFAVRILGIWPLEHDETPFGSDSSLPIALPARSVPARAGVFRRTGTTIEVVPAPGALLKYDGVAMKGPSAVEEFNIGPVNVQLFSMGEGTGRAPLCHRFGRSASGTRASGRDRDLPGGRAMEGRGPLRRVRFTAGGPHCERQGRVLRVVRSWRAGVPRERSGTAAHRARRARGKGLLRHVQGRDQRFDDLRVPNAQSARCARRRMDRPRFQHGVESPVCVPHRTTTCPLPPAKNRVQAAIEAGEKRHPTAKGFSAP